MLCVPISKKITMDCTLQLERILRLKRATLDGEMDAAKRKQSVTCVQYSTAMHLRIGLVCFKVKISQLNVCNKLHNDDDQFPKTISIKSTQICFRLAQLKAMKNNLR